MKIRLLHLAITFFSLSFVTRIYAQMDVDLVNSQEILGEADLYWMLGKYSKAEDVYKKVGRNDTNYALVLRNLALTYTEDKEDSLCLLTAYRGLALNSEYEPDFYNSLGISLKELEKYDTALATFDAGIKKYPYRYLLYYNKGMTYFKMKKYPEAQKCFEDAIKINPYHANSHFQLGKTCAEQGRLVPAVLSYEYYLLLEPGTDRSGKVVSALEDLFSGDYSPDPDLKLDSKEAGDDCFSDIQELITSGIAVAPNYPNKTKIKLKMVKQFQAILEKLEFKSDTHNWWMENYVPFFIEVQKNDYLIPFESYTLISQQDATVRKSVKKNKKKILAFATWAGKYINDHTDHPAKELFNDSAPNGSDKFKYTFYDNHMLAGEGYANANDIEHGNWIFFDGRSGHVSAKGKFDDSGERDGEWNWFFGDGTLKEKTKYMHGNREGESVVYYESGVMKFKCNFSHDLLDGDYTLYNITGSVDEKASMSAGKLDGLVTVYYNNGTKKAELNYIAGKLNGDLIFYSIDGKVSKKVANVNAKRSGKSEEYYNNGKMKIEGEYKNDFEFGPWKYYWDNGKTMREGKYNATGNRDGVWKEYYRDGTLSVEAGFTNGKLNGNYTDYDIDGKISSVKVYASDKMKKETFYDKKGKVIAEYNTSKSVTVVEYFPTGEKQSEGDYYQGEKDGDWKYYSSNGGWLRSKQHYRGGYLSGTKKNYFRNGKERDEVDYSFGEKDGYWKSFYQNGNIESEGWYVNDSKEGDWFEYNVRGIQTAHRYYMQGEMQGYQEYFDEKGKKDEEDYYKESNMWSRTRFDSTGAILYKFESKNGTGTYEYNYPNGKTMVTQEYKNGYLDGSTLRFTFDGGKSIETTFLSGNQHGKRTEYFDESGKVSLEVNYQFDERQGTCNAFWENGNKRWEENYYDGDLDGTQKYYYENGVLQKEGVWDMGTLNGELKMYSDDGQLEMVRYYFDGNLIGYSYNDKEGNLLPMTKLDDASGKFTCYYQNGNKSIEGEYEYGKFNGKVSEYFSDGKLYADINYVYGDYEGVQKYYNHQGILVQELNYYGDELDGVSKYYSDDGKLEHIETHVLGDDFGTWVYYNPDGTEKVKKGYYDNRQISETKAAVAPLKPDPKGKPKSGKGK
jgi:antitoxin component YwqK of YwqJK toxin-antitoxin module/Tfp pilus assembly protein PilF